MQFLSKLGLNQGGSGGDLPARAAALAPNAVAVLLVVALAAQLAWFVWQVLSPPAPQRPPASPMRPSTLSGPDVAAIVKAHLFGTAAVQATGNAANAPTTNLRLVLAGTLAGKDPSHGWAIVGESAQSAKVYPTGANLPGGATLKEVYADRIILDRGGHLESLPLPRLTEGAVVATASYNQPASQPNLAETVQNLVRQDPGAVTEILRPQPVFAGGQQKGYRVYPGTNRAEFAKLGLMPGDLVTAVNGTPLNDPNSGLQALRGVGTGGPVTLTVERNGTEQQVTVDPSKVMSELPIRRPTNRRQDNIDQED